MPKNQAVSRPDEVVMFEKELGLKFKGPYSDGREWDAILQAKGEIDYMMKIGEFGKWLESKGFTKKSQDINTTFAVKLKKSVHLGVEVAQKGWQITIYYDN
jgi:hypothetical protein